MHYVNLFAQAADRLMPQPTAELPSEDVLDVIAQQRKVARAAGDDNAAPDPRRVLPAELTRRFEVYIEPRAKTTVKPRSVRTVLAEDIGHLVVVKGMVTRVTDVRPLVAVATYTCEDCGSEIFQQVTGVTFTPLEQCPSQACTTNRRTGRLVLQTRGSRFIRTQEMRLQELPDQVPVGHIPRAMTVMMRGEHTRKVLPGDIVTIGGVYLPRPLSLARGGSSMGLLAETFLEAMTLTLQKQRNAKDASVCGGTSVK